MSKRATRGPRPVDPMGTLPMFDTINRDGALLAAGRFRCGLCNTMGVDEAGELCESCADHVLTEKCRYRRPADAAETATRAPRKPRAHKSTPKTPTTAPKGSTARKGSSARKSAAGSSPEGVR